MRRALALIGAVRRDAWLQHLLRPADAARVEESRTRVAAAHAALAPYGWRRLTLEMVVRRVLAVVDGGACPGSTVARDDPRVGPVVSAVSGVPWRGLCLDALCRLLLGAVDDQQSRDVLLDLELAWLLDEGV